MQLTNFFRPAYLPYGWSALTHPSDGSIYYFQSNQPLKIITRIDMPNTEVQECMKQSSQSVALALSDRRISFTDQTEVYIQARTQDPSSISYYMVDHQSRTVYWMDHISPNMLGLPPDFSELHLRLSRLFVIATFSIAVNISHFDLKAPCRINCTGITSLFSRHIVMPLSVLCWESSLMLWSPVLLVRILFELSENKQLTISSHNKIFFLMYRSTEIHYYFRIPIFLRRDLGTFGIY